MATEMTALELSNARSATLCRLERAIFYINARIDQGMGGVGLRSQMVELYQEIDRSQGLVLQAAIEDAREMIEYQVQSGHLQGMDTPAPNAERIDP